MMKRSYSCEEECPLEMDASQSSQPFVVICYLGRRTIYFLRKKEMETFGCCPLKMQLLVVGGEDP